MSFLKRWKIRLLIFFAVVGPGFITANVDNDAALASIRAEVHELNKRFPLP